MEKFIDHIEGYLLGSLGQPEKDLFDKELARNPELQQIVDNFPLVKKTIAAGVEDEAHQAIKNARSRIQPKNNRVFWKASRLLKYAASILIVISLASIIYSNFNYTAPKLVSSHYVAPSDFTTFMGTDSKSKSEQLREIWDSGDLEKAIQFASDWKSQESNNLNLAYSLAHLHFQNEDYGESEKLFSDLLSDRRYKSDAEFHLALCHYMLGTEDQAREQLMSISKDSNHPFHEEATEMLKKINSFWRRLVI